MCEMTVKEEIQSDDDFGQRDQREPQIVKLESEVNIDIDLQTDAWNKVFND